MALGMDRLEVMTDISSFMNESTNVERGGIACYSNGGSGAALDQASNLVTYAANPSGSKPAGLVMIDHFAGDITRQHVNFYKAEGLKGQKTCLLVEGWVVTDRVMPGVSPNPGDTAYVGNSGLLTSVFQNLAASPKVGQFRGRKNENGFIKVWIDMNG